MGKQLPTLTKEDIADREAWKNRYPYLQKRSRILGDLLDCYSRWDVGERGRSLDGGRLYEKFKSLTPEELAEIETRAGDRR